MCSTGVLMKERTQAWRDLARLIDTEGGIYYYPKPQGIIVKASIANTNRQLLKLTLKNLPIAFNTLQITRAGTVNTYGIPQRKSCYNLMCTRQDLLYPLLNAVQQHLFDSDKQNNCKQALQHLEKQINSLSPFIKQEITNKLINLGWTPEELQQYAPVLPNTANQSTTHKQQHQLYLQQRGATPEEIQDLTPEEMN